MIKIALTGPSGSGKGYVGALFEKRCIPCLDTDQTVHELYRDPEFAKELSSALNHGICAADRTIDRPALARLIFENDDAMKTLLALVYPAVRKKCKAFFEAQEASGKKAAVIDAPQLFEAGFEEDVDLIVTVDAPEDLRLQRVIARDGISEEYALQRMKRQRTGEEYAACSHYVLVNDGKNDVEAALDALLCKILK